MTTEMTKDKNVCGGKTCIKGTRIRVIDIVERYKFLGEKPEEIAIVYDIPVEAVFASLSYYYGHIPELREEMEHDKDLAKKLRSEIRPVAYATSILC